MDGLTGLSGVRRNEIQGKIAPRTVDGWIKAPDTFVPYLVRLGRRERGARTEPHPAQQPGPPACRLSDRGYPGADPPRQTARDPSQSTTRRVPGPTPSRSTSECSSAGCAKGQCFHRPYLGCREFACQFAPPDGSERPVT